MAAAIHYLTTDEVVKLHDRALELMGQPRSLLLHPHKLDSAVHRPLNFANYEGADLFTQAVALAVGVSQAQAFEDGNKRAAFAAARTFLRMNGVQLHGEPMTFACWLICAAGRISAAETAEVVKYLGLELASKLDVMKREEVESLFEEWLRATSSGAPLM